MAASDITVAALTAASTLRGNKLAWTYSDPRNNALPNIGLDMVEVHASTTNDRATATKVGEGITDFLHAGLVEEQTWYYWIKARDYLGGYGAWYPSGSTSGVSAKAIGMTGLAFGLANGKLVATVTAGVLTIAVKTSAGNDPSSTDPVFASFRNASAALGSYSILTITGPLSLTISSGSTMGVPAINQPCRLWVVMLNDAGTPRLGAANCTIGNSTLQLNESLLYSSTAEGGSGGADSATTIYTSVAVTSVPMRIISFLDFTSGLATLGTWVAPNPINMFAATMKAPGDQLSFLSANHTYIITTTNVIPDDTTIPQVTEGEEVANIILDSIASVINLAEIDLLANVTCTAAGIVCLAAFKDGGGTDAIAVAWGYVPAANATIQVRLKFSVQLATVSPVRYRFRGGSTVAGTFQFNSTKFGGKLISPLMVREIVG